MAVGCGGFLLSVLCIVPPVLWLAKPETVEPSLEVLPAPSEPSDPSLLPPRPPDVRRPHRVTARIEEVRGVPGLRRGATCSFDVTRHPRPDGTFWCNAQVTCGGQLVYGGTGAGYFECTLYDQPERHVVGEDPGTTSEDGDAAMRLDTLREELTVRDDARGRLGELTLRARVTRVR